MDTFASPIRISVAPDRVLQSWVAAGHVLTFGVLLCSFPRGIHTTMLLTLVTASLLLQLRSTQDLRRRASAVLLGADDRWSIISPAGEISRAEALRGTFLSTSLVVIRLKPAGKPPLRLVFTRSNTPATAFRRLRVRLGLPMTASRR